MINKPTFCVFPFIAQHYSLDGNKYFCCLGTDDINDPAKALELKKAIANGEQIKHCEECYKVEQLGGTSMRIRENNQWLKDPEVVEYIENWQPDSIPRIFFYDVRPSNKCNLQCISCKPLFSSLWEKELGIEVPHQPPVLDYNKMARVKKIYLAGGEPLVIEEFLTLLEMIAGNDIQPEVVINTNLTRVGDKVREVLSGIKNLTLTISVDAYGSVNEYHRYPMKWDKFMRNLEWASELDCTLMFNTVVDAISVLNLHKLVELEEYIDFWTLTFVVKRPWLEVNNIPAGYKPFIVSNLETLKRSKFYVQEQFKAQVNAIIEQVQKQGDPEALASVLTEMDARRGISYKDYIDIDLEDYI